MASIDSLSPDLLSGINGSSRKSIAAEAQDRFMTLLVTQMKNQDPLNPLDNAQVTSQLAQLSTVTGIDKLNTSLEALKASFQSGQTLQAASMIGRQVLVPGSQLELANGKAAFGIELAEPADRVTAIIHDAAGNALRQIELGARSAGMATASWDGKYDNGASAADGSYQFRIEASRAGQKISTLSLAAGGVASVSASSLGVRLNIDGIGDTALSEVRQIM